MIFPASSVTRRPSSALAFAQFLPQQAHEFAALGRGHLTPGVKGLHGARDGGFRLFRSRIAQLGDLFPRDGRTHDAAAPRDGIARDAEAFEKGDGFLLRRRENRRESLSEQVHRFHSVDARTDPRAQSRVDR